MEYELNDNIINYINNQKINGAYFSINQNLYKKYKLLLYFLININSYVFDIKFKLKTSEYYINIYDLFNQNIKNIFFVNKKFSIENKKYLNYYNSIINLTNINPDHLNIIFYIFELFIKNLEQNIKEQNINIKNFGKFFDHFFQYKVNGSYFISDPTKITNFFAKNNKILDFDLRFEILIPKSNISEILNYMLNNYFIKII